MRFDVFLNIQVFVNAPGLRLTKKKKKKKKKRVLEENETEGISKYSLSKMDAFMNTASIC